MRIIRLPLHPSKYSSNVYFILGEWNKLEDQNTLIDVGIDSLIVQHIEQINTGVGKKKVSQIIITHEHFDHKAGLKFIKPIYQPLVYAYALDELVDVKITDGMSVILGDREAILLHTPGHSNDSISVYVPDEGVIFTGDLPIGGHLTGETFTLTYLNTLRKLSMLEIKDIYPGHGDPLIGNGSRIIKHTLNIVESAKIIS